MDRGIFVPRGVQLVHTVEANNGPLQLVIHVVQRPSWRARDALRRRLPCEQTHLYELYSARGKN